MSQRSIYGGEAVFDGVMMRGANWWSLAVRRPSGEIQVSVHAVPAWMKATRNVPLVRGLFALAASVVLGSRALQDSIAIRDENPKPMTWRQRFATVAAALVIVGFFLWIPLAIAKLAFPGDDHALAFSTLESVLRIALLFGYLAVLSISKDVKKVFAYHGAEHQTISAREAGAELTPDSVQQFSRRHPRCGTAFLLLIFVVGTLLHALVGNGDTGWLLAVRVVLMPLTAGLVYEFLRASSAHLDQPWARVLAWPGLTLQRLTTRPASADQIEVAIAALDAVVKADENDKVAA